MIVETFSRLRFILSFLVFSIIVANEACNLAWKIRQIITQLAISLSIKLCLLAYELNKDIHECLKVGDSWEIEVAHIVREIVSGKFILNWQTLHATSRNKILNSYFATYVTVFSLLFLNNIFRITQTLSNFCLIVNFNFITILNR